MKIRSIEAIPVRVPVSKLLMITSAHGSHDVSEYVIVKVLTDEGISGVGEATVDPVWSGETQTSAKHCIDKLLTPCLLDQDPTNVELLGLRMDRAVKGYPFTKAALEMALHDINARAVGLPLYKLLGGKVRDSVPIKFSISATTPSAAVEAAQHLFSAGIRTLKIKVGIDRNADLERVRAVREALPDAKLGVDANGGWSVAEAKVMIGNLEKYDIDFVEQPVDPADVRWMMDVKRSVNVPIVADESVFTLSDAMAVISQGAADVLNIYPGKNGGISNTKKIAAVAQAANVKCLVGSNLELGIASAAMIHLACSTPAIDSDLYPADIIGPLYHAEDVLQERLKIENGYAFISDKPGLGVELDDEKLKRLTQ